MGPEKSVTLPDGSLLDLYPTPQDEIGTAYAARAAVGEDARLGLARARDAKLSGGATGPGDQVARPRPVASERLDGSPSAASQETG